MSLRPSELIALAAEVSRELAHAVIQKVYAPTTTRVYLEVRVPGRTHTLLLCSDVGVARLSAVDARPANPPTPPTWQHVLRRELTGAALLDAEALPAQQTLLLHLGKGEARLTLALEVGTPAIVLLNRGATVLSSSIPGRVRVGQGWAPPQETGGALDAPSRLQSELTVLRLAHGAEALLSQVEQVAWQRAQRHPLELKLKRLLRTQEKVRADAARVDGAADFQRDGTLLSRNLGRLTRGMTSVTLPDYLSDGSVVERTIALDPARTPQKEVAWRFKQHRRLVRGAELAVARLAQLQAEEAELRRVIAEGTSTAAVAPTRVPRRSAPVAKAFREYRGHQDQPIWVGKGSAHNDELTFHLAKPHHVWLHARGVPGAHVVIPLNKGQTVSSELLLDAAHLALHHSDAKHEPRAEVSWVPVKYVRSAGAPGAVTYTQEKTLMLRVEPERLQRLLRTEAGS